MALETELHINLLELKAVYFGIKALCKDLSNTHIKILVDNATPVLTINNMGSCKSVECDKAVSSIWEWAKSRNIWITTAQIPGKLNVEADLESRKNQAKTKRIYFCRYYCTFQILSSSEPVCS